MIGKEEDVGGKNLIKKKKKRKFPFCSLKKKQREFLKELFFLNKERSFEKEGEEV